MSDDHGKAIEAVEVGAGSIALDGDQQMHPLVAAAMANSPTPDTIEKLLDLQRQWEADQAKRYFTAALIGLRHDLPSVIRRDKKVDFTSNRTKERTTYTHTSLGEVMDQITGPLATHGFSLAWKPRTERNIVYVTCILTHAAGHSEECTIDSPPDSSGRKGPAQAVASTITLLERYTALALLGIATADMDEPHGEHLEENLEEIDQDLNIRAASAIRKKLGGIYRAEEHVGKAMPAWTVGDVNELREWLKDVEPEEEV